MGRYLVGLSRCVRGVRAEAMAMAMAMIGADMDSSQTRTNHPLVRLLLAFTSTMKMNWFF